MAQRRTTTEQIEATKKEIEQKEKRIKELLQKQRKEERKARTHRLCERGGLVEKLLPDLIKLTPEQFEVFVRKTMLTGFTERVIKELLPPTEPQGGTAAETGTGVSEPQQAAQPPAEAAHYIGAGAEQNGRSGTVPGAGRIH